MTQTSTDKGALATWSNPECHFAIKYSRKALDDIRLAVVDAFFSLPRGGAEIGGVLLGRVDEQQVQILDYAPIECEHAFGPAFTLSPADQVRLGEMLRQPFPGGLHPVGWYHSHTRSEIALSDADMDIYSRYFPERWQVALVLRPSTLQPTQGGFFFREADGSTRAESSYQEFVVEALPLQPAPAGLPQATPGAMRETEPDSVVMNLRSGEPALVSPPVSETQSAAERQGPERIAAAPEPPTREPIVARMSEPEPSRGLEAVVSGAPPLRAPAAAAMPSKIHAEPPHTDESEPGNQHEGSDQGRSYLMHHDERPKPRRGWAGIAAGLLAGVAFGVAADQARSHAKPAERAAPAPVAAQRQAPGLESAALRKRYDDLTRQVAELTQQNGALRQQNTELSKQQTESTKQQAELNKAQGEAGQHQAELRQQRDDLAKQTAKLKADLSAQTTRAQSLQQQLEDLRRQQQRRRLSIQSSDPLP